MLRASIVPADALLPIAAAQAPVTSAADVALDVVVTVVAAVVLTVTAPEPNSDVTTKDDVEIDAIVPKAPPKPWPRNPPPNPPREPGDPDGIGCGPPVPPLDGPPVGGVPPPNPPDCCPHPVVLVTETLAAMTREAAESASGLVLVTATQSPVASDDRGTDETLENRVLVAHATVVVPVADRTAAPAESIETTLPETAPKFAAN